MRVLAAFMGLCKSAVAAGCAVGVSGEGTELLVPTPAVVKTPSLRPALAMKPLPYESVLCV